MSKYPFSVRVFHRNNNGFQDKAFETLPAAMHFMLTLPPRAYRRAVLSVMVHEVTISLPERRG